MYVANQIRGRVERKIIEKENREKECHTYDAEGLTEVERNQNKGDRDWKSKRHREVELDFTNNNSCCAMYVCATLITRHYRRKGEPKSNDRAGVT